MTAQAVASRRLCQAAISVGAAVSLVGLGLALPDGAWMAASFQGLCLVFNAIVWFGLVHARALLDAQIAKARADAELAALSLQMLHQAIDAGHPVVSIPVGRVQ